MYLRIIGNEFSKKFFMEVATISDHAKLRPRDVSYDEESGLVTLPLVRFPVIKTGMFRNYKYDFNKPINAVVVVRNVRDCVIDDNTSDEMDKVNLLFGLNIKGDEVIVSSAEENRGTACYLIIMTVTDIDIEIKDDHNG